MKKLNWTITITWMIGVLLMIFTVHCDAAKLYAIVKMKGGVPMIGELKYHGYVLCDQKGEYGAYLITGTAKELAAIAAYKDVTPIGDTKQIETTITDEKGTRIELIDPVMTKVNTDRINALSLSTAKVVAKEGATIKATVVEQYKAFNSKFELNGMSIIDPDDTKPVEPVIKEPIVKEVTK